MRARGTDSTARRFLLLLPVCVAAGLLFAWRVDAGVSGLLGLVVGLKPVLPLLR